MVRMKSTLIGKEIKTYERAGKTLDGRAPSGVLLLIPHVLMLVNISNLSKSSTVVLLDIICGSGTRSR